MVEKNPTEYEDKPPQYQPYQAPSGPPPSQSNDRGLFSSLQPPASEYQNQYQNQSYQQTYPNNYQQNYPPQGYPPQNQGGYYGPPPAGYYSQPQPIYIQQETRRPSNTDSFLAACLAVCCACCMLDFLF
ncbi:uncharacterized protein ASCRUDRAFT_74498 [Ascoidea rubescens DSM 1968]|uniref:Cysteine-rich transmembrane CYSTM domain-containing protein n=1 Tax=Ascoidea rubescens DSM 1968 TaxID=1344418 RepID=A0A1D2VNF8_9ASCO|nr:hypothetical protein ASCRUDRAFT_74498 [Ascoidea rubescens DSM 1968]ODV63107.1 hypothetical protein ASCRUDRAFT_74498 [Ascoidea rubescens DSM 1968]